MRLSENYSINLIRIQSFDNFGGETKIRKRNKMTNIQNQTSIKCQKNKHFLIINT